MITGRLTANSELKYSGGGAASIRFSVAVGRYSNGKTETSFFDCIQWGKITETLAPLMSKGKAVVVRGEMRQEHWQGQDGAKRSKWVLVADGYGVQLLSAGNNEETGRGSRTGGRNQSNQNNNGQDDWENASSGGEYDQDIPF
jgi:single-strand DNA-binding protein